MLAGLPESVETELLCLIAHVAYRDARLLMK